VRNPEEALRYLERNYELRSPDLLGIKVDPIFAALRSDDRFQDLVRRVGLS
jgi:hypothetical protein